MDRVPPYMEWASRQCCDLLRFNIINNANLQVVVFLTQQCSAVRTLRPQRCTPYKIAPDATTYLLPWRLVV